MTIGAAFDRSGVGFTQSSELGYLNPDRTVTGVGAFGDGVTGGTVDGEPYDTRVNLDGTVQTVSAYATDTMTAGAWNVTLSGRVNRIAIDNRDLVRPAPAARVAGRQLCLQRASTPPPASPTTRARA